MGFKLKMRKKNEIPILDVIGEVTGENIRKITHKLDYFRKGSFETVAVDLSGTTFIDSHGLGAFIYCWRMLEEQGRKLVFLSPQGFVRTMFSGTNLDKIFKILESEEDL